MHIIHLVPKNRHVKLAGNGALRIEREHADPKDRAQYVRDILRAWGRRWWPHCKTGRRKAWPARSLAATATSTNAAGLPAPPPP